MPQDDEIQLETRLTSAKGFLPYVATAAAILGIVIIILTMTTDMGARLLPMDEAYDAYIAPAAADGSEALALTVLDQELKDNKNLSVSGVVVNRTAFPISGLLAVVDTRDRFTLPIATIEFPVMPDPLPAGDMGAFQGTANLEKEIASYSIRFRLADGGVFVSHRDERIVIPQPTDAPPAAPK